MNASTVVPVCISHPEARLLYVGYSIARELHVLECAECGASLTWRSTAVGRATGLVSRIRREGVQDSTQRNRYMGDVAHGSNDTASTHRAPTKIRTETLPEGDAA